MESPNDAADSSTRPTLIVFVDELWSRDTSRYLVFVPFTINPAFFDLSRKFVARIAVSAALCRGPSLRMTDSRSRLKRVGAIGSPCLRPVDTLKGEDNSPPYLTQHLEPT